MISKDSLNFRKDLENAASCLHAGGLILYPTDTIWGIGCDATNSDAVKRIYKLKQRDDSKSMLVLVNDEEALKNLVKEIPGEAKRLINESLSPLTVIYDNPEGVSQELVADDGSLGIRITKEKFSNELCKNFGKPIVSTSANISGEVSPSNFIHISQYIKDGVDYIVEYGRNDQTVKSPSSIIKVTKEGGIKVIR